MRLQRIADLLKSQATSNRAHDASSGVLAANLQDCGTAASQVVHSRKTTAKPMYGFISMLLYFLINYINALNLCYVVCAKYDSRRW